MANDTNSVGFLVTELLDRTVQAHPGKIAIVARDEELTFEELNRRVNALASHLRAEGICPGDRVGIWLPNSAAIPLSYYATQRIGAVTVILDARLRGKELQTVLADADLSLLITQAQLYAEAREALQNSRPVALWIVNEPGERSFEKRSTNPVAAVAAAKPNIRDDALLLYTSGTTGEPKGVVLDFENLAQYPRVMREMGITDSLTVRGCVLPMSHIVGPLVCNELADKGFTLVIFDQMNPVTLLEGIQKHRISVFEAVPVVFQLLLGVRNLSEYDTSSVKIAAMMGTTVPIPLLRAFMTTQPHIKVIQGYGLTETSPLITLVEPNRAVEKIGSIGRAVPGVKVKIVDDNGNEVPSGNSGEIVTAGPHIMKGYFRNPSATAARVRNGWLHTGDVGKVDSDGYYYHLGRCDDLIITGGLNVYPAEIENIICLHPKVQEAVVFPIPDKLRGAVIGAAVIARPQERIAEKELLTFLRANLASFKVPHKIAIREALPRTSSGKVIRDAGLLLSPETSV